MRFIKIFILSSLLLLPASAQKIRLGNQTQGTLPVSQGGTGATTASAAVTGLGAAPAVHTHAASDIVSGKHGSTTLLQTFVGGTEPTAGNAACWDSQHNLTDCGVPAGGGGGGGTVSNAANVGSQGFGLFKVLSGGILDFFNLNPLSSRISFANNSTLNTVDVDVNESALNMNNTGTILGIAKGGTGASNKTTAFDALSPLSTKGDIVVYNGADNVRLGVGTDGQALVADSTQPNGVKWGTVAGGGGSSITNAIDLGDFKVVRTSSTQLTIGSSCTTSEPCLVRIGNNVYRYTTSATANISAGTGTAYVYIGQDGTLTVGHNVTLTCTSCTAVSGVTSFPATSVPIATWSATTTAGQWDVSGGTDMRAYLARSNYFAGQGLLGSTTGGNTTLSIDQSTVSTFASGGSVPGSCTAYGQLFFNSSGASGAKMSYCNGATFESISAGGGGGTVPTVFSTLGIGHYLPFGLPDPTAAQTYSSATLFPKAFQFTLPFQATIGHFIINTKGVCTSCGLIVEIHNATTADTVGSLVVSSTTLTAIPRTSGIQAITITSPVTLAPGVYWLTILSEDTAFTMAPVAQGTTILSYLNAIDGASSIRAGHCSNAGTGTGGTLAMPASCGTVATDNTIAQPFVVFAP